MSLAHPHIYGKIQKLIYVSMSTGCFIKFSLGSSMLQNRNDIVFRVVTYIAMCVLEWFLLTYILAYNFTFHLLLTHAYQHTLIIKSTISIFTGCTLHSISCTSSALSTVSIFLSVDSSSTT